MLHHLHYCQGHQYVLNLTKPPEDHNIRCDRSWNCFKSQKCSTYRLCPTLLLCFIRCGDKWWCAQGVFGKCLYWNALRMNVFLLILCTVQRVFANENRGSCFTERLQACHPGPAWRITFWIHKQSSSCTSPGHVLLCCFCADLYCWVYKRVYEWTNITFICFYINLEGKISEILYFPWFYEWKIPKQVAYCQLIRNHVFLCMTDLYCCPKHIYSKKPRCRTGLSFSSDRTVHLFCHFSCSCSASIHHEPRSKIL